MEFRFEAREQRGDIQTGAAVRCQGFRDKAPAPGKRQRHNELISKMFFHRGVAVPEPESAAGRMACDRFSGTSAQACFSEYRDAMPVPQFNQYGIARAFRPGTSVPAVYHAYGRIGKTERGEFGREKRGAFPFCNLVRQVMGINKRFRFQCRTRFIFRGFRKVISEHERFRGSHAYRDAAAPDLHVAGTGHGCGEARSHAFQPGQKCPGHEFKRRSAGHMGSPCHRDA